MGVSLTINRATNYASTQPLRSRNICIYIYIENRKVYVENGVKCWNFTTR